MAATVHLLGWGLRKMGMVGVWGFICVYLDAAWQVGVASARHPLAVHLQPGHLGHLRRDVRHPNIGAVGQIVQPPDEVRKPLPAGDCGRFACEWVHMGV